MAARESQARGGHGTLYLLWLYLPSLYLPSLYLPWLYLPSLYLPSLYLPWLYLPWLDKVKPAVAPRCACTYYGCTYLLTVTVPGARVLPR